MHVERSRVHVIDTKYTKYTQFLKITKITKYELWNLSILHNKSLMFFDVSEKFQNNQTFRRYFDIVGVFCTIYCYFEYRIRILCI